MARCEVCGNEYDKTFEVTAAGRRHVFDSFECAIHALAPVCAHCGCKVIGHGIDANGTFYCCAHCARSEGVKGVADHV
jgi:Rieske Fe-S protein